MSSSRYSDWRVALASVQGIYLIADNSTGQLYIGKADGAERILGRWMAYARDGHGGNIALRGLSEVDATHASTSYSASCASLVRALRPPRLTEPSLTSRTHFWLDSLG